ncbi:MAG TPA: DUF1674 domain-containing protein [Steroidobacteraceae bacterium]|nr:DUF1674 domain-containing protein [Steroidobacteraceae bacterium]
MPSDLNEKTPTEAPLSKSAPVSETKNKQPREIGGRDGPDPTRFGDWEKAGRCIDF